MEMKIAIGSMITEFSFLLNAFVVNVFFFSSTYISSLEDVNSHFYKHKKHLIIL